MQNGIEVAPLLPNRLRALNKRPFFLKMGKETRHGLNY